MFCSANDDSNGYQCNQQDLGPASDSKMAAAVNMHTFELLLKNHKFCGLNNLILTEFSLKISLYLRD